MNKSKPNNNMVIKLFFSVFMGITLLKDVKVTAPTFEAISYILSLAILITSLLRETIIGETPMCIYKLNIKHA